MKTNIYEKSKRTDASNRSFREKETGNGSFLRRVYFLFLLFLIIGAIIFLRLYFLQIFSYSSFKLLAEGQHSIFKELVPERGEIFLKDKAGPYPVAVNRETKFAYAVPKEIENILEAVNFLSETLSLDKGELWEKINKPNDGYELLKHKLSEEEIRKIEESKMKGVRLMDESYRYYPAGELGANVLGFVGWKENEVVGRYGIEAYFEDKLKGRPGKLFQNRDPLGRWIPIGKREKMSAEDGTGMILTIDHIIQFEAEKILRGAMKKFDAERGSVVVLEPMTGKILAMANYPTFNPNEYSKVENMDSFRNLAVNDAYEIGSVFKTFTLAVAVDDGKINSETTYVDTGAVKEAGYTIQNSDYKAYGLQTMNQVLGNSLNTGVIFAQKLVGNAKFAEYMKNFGFGSTTGVEMFGEAPGNIRNLKNLKSDIQFFTASFGQGITVTGLQTAIAYGAIANGGLLMKPQIIDTIIHHDGREEKIQPEEVRRVISEEASKEATEMLRFVVTDGHGKRAGVPGYEVCGKTGTAQVASSTKKGYEEGKNIGSFAGFAPCNDPKFVVMVRMDNPKNVEWAESSAAPAFGELMKFLLEYEKIEPTKSFEQKDMDAFNLAHDLHKYSMEEDEEKTEEKKEEEKNKQ